MVNTNLVIKSDWKEFEELLVKLNKVKEIRDAQLLIAKEVSRKQADPDKVIRNRSIVFETNQNTFDLDYAKDANQLIIEYATRPMTPQEIDDEDYI